MILKNFTMNEKFTHEDISINPLFEIKHYLRLELIYIYDVLTNQFDHSSSFKGYKLLLSFYPHKSIQNHSANIILVVLYHKKVSRVDVSYVSKITKSLKLFLNL